MDPSRHPTEVGSQAIDLHPPATPSKQPSSTSTSLSFGLPSPTSLPRLVEHTHSGSDLVGMSLGSASFVDGDARRQEAVDPMDECELVDSATSEDSSSSPPPNEDYAMAMFPLDVEMLSTSSSSPGDLPNSSGALSHDDSRSNLAISSSQPADELAIAREAFSSARPIQRAYRARYSEPTLDSPTLPSSLDMSIPIDTFSTKRSHDAVSPSSVGSTPPSELLVAEGEDSVDAFSPFSSSTTTTTGSTHSRRASYSFDAQRVPVSNNLMAARYLREHDSAANTLRRRSPMSSRTGSRSRRSDPTGSTTDPTTNMEEEGGLGALDRVHQDDRSKRRRSHASTEHEDEDFSSTRSSFDLSVPTSSSSTFPGRFPPRGLAIDPLLSPAHSTSTTYGGRSDNRLSLPSLLVSSTSPASPTSPQHDDDTWPTSTITSSSSASSPPRRSVPSFPSFSSFRRLSSSSTNTNTTPSRPSLPTTGSSTSIELDSHHHHPTNNPTSLLRPRSARARPDPIRERELNHPLVSFWREERELEEESREVDRRGREVLERAERRLWDAERQLRSSRRILRVEGEEAVEAEEEGEGDEFERVLRQTTRAMQRTTRLLRGVPRESNSSTTTAEAVELATRLPSTQHLPPPGSGSRNPPIVGVRLGEGWRTPNNARRSSNVTINTNDLSPSTSRSTASSSEERPPNTTATSPSSPSRSLQFLSNLRTRRPRLSRNSTGVPPPEESPEVPTAEREARGWLVAPVVASPSSNTDQPPIASSSTAAWDTTTTTTMNTQPRVIGRRSRSRPRASESLERLWGEASPPARATEEEARADATAAATIPLVPRWEMRSGGGGHRMRGPTERANERWRSGQEPVGLVDTVGTTTPSSSSRDVGDTEEWSLPLWARRAPVEVAPFGRASSPSPNRRRRTSLDLHLEEQGSLPSTSSSTTPRVAIPFPAPSTTTTRDGGNNATTFRITTTRRAPPSEAFAGESSEDERMEEGEGWRPAQGGLPPMLSSGSAGRRVEDERPWESDSVQRDLDSIPITTGASRYHHGPFGFEPSSRYAPAPSFFVHRPGRANPAPSTSPPSASTAAGAQRPLPTRTRTTLADALAHFGVPRGSPPATTTDDSTPSGTGFPTLRRRRAASEAADQQQQARLAALGESIAERRERARAEMGAARTERLASLRNERSVMRNLLGGVGGGAAAREGGGGFATTTATTTNGEGGQDVAVPRSPPGLRRRGLGEFFRGMSGGRLGMLDDDFTAFFWRDSAAADQRNYMDDDEFDGSYDALLRLSERLGDVKPKGGASQSKLSALPRFKYEDWPLPTKSTSVEPPVLGIATTSSVTMDEPTLARKGLEKEERCGVCLQDYEDDDECMLGLCQHGFHAECLTAWLQSTSSCPVCRRDHS